MVKNTIIVLGAMLSILTAGEGAFAQQQFDGTSAYSDIRGRNSSFERRNERQPRMRDPYAAYKAPQQGGDSAMVAAVVARRHVHFVEASGMLVVEVLPDDNQGLRHQKFVVQLSNGASMLAVYNLDMESCDRIPLKKGDLVSMGGEFKWTGQGALLHWLHYDPSQRRPDGYVQLNGVDYCRGGQRRH